MSFTQWAEEHGYNHEYVSHELNGAIRTTLGRSHEIAMKIGLKVAA